MESVIEVLSNVFEPKQNAITDYVLPILKNTLVFLDEQQEKIKEKNHIITKIGSRMHSLKQANKDLRNNLEKELNNHCLKCDFKKVEFYNQITSLEGKIQDLKKENARLKKQKYR